MSESRVLIERFDSHILKSNFLGDPSDRRVAVYLPPGYDDNPDTRYPTVFLLTGFTGRGTMLLNESFWDENIRERLDRLIEADQVPPLIIVMPDCSTRYGGSQYINSNGTGRYEDYVIQEIIPWSDSRFRTIRDRRARGVMGKSSGGYGSLILAMHNPDVFGLMACHSGDMYFELCYGPDFIRSLKAIPKFGGLREFVKSFRHIHPKDGDFHAVINTIGMASCYSPNPYQEIGFELPFDESTGEWKKEVWSSWKLWDPVERFSEYLTALATLDLLYLDAGKRDEFNLQFGARTLTARLARAGIPYRFEEFDDGHANIAYRYDISLKAMGEIWRREGIST